MDADERNYTLTLCAANLANGCRPTECVEAMDGLEETSRQRRREKGGRLDCEARATKGLLSGDGMETVMAHPRTGGSHGADHGDFKSLDLPHY